ncbi:MAG: hypothetical protein HYS13_19845 [Planctomycetia bacterium]|nr:hypothetical protein [Planctomycetia bacterium]
MKRSLTDIGTLRSVLDRLDAERPAVEPSEFGRTHYVPRGDEFLKRLDLDVQSRPGKTRLLVTGQIGVGKSSELWCYFRTVKQQRRAYPVYCDLEKQESPERCSATGVLLTMLRDCWGALNWYLGDPQSAGTSQLRQLIKIREEILTRLIDYLNGSRSADGSEVVFRFRGMDFRVVTAENRKNAALALVLGKAAQHEAVSEPSEKFGVAPDALVVLLNQLLRWMTNKFRGHRPVLLIDHVDKIRDPDAAEDVLVRAFTHWDRVDASLIMTAPFEFTLGQSRGPIESRWGPPKVLYPVDIPDPDAGPVPDIYSSIARTAGLDELLPDDSLRLMAHYSGGILRPFVQFLIGAAKEAHLSSHEVIEPTDALAEIHRQETAYQDYRAEDLRLLDEVVRSGTGLRDTPALLRSPIGLLVAKGEAGQQSLLVHPLARRALERYHRRMKVAV